MSTVVALVGTRRIGRVVERNARAYLRMWPAFVSGFAEPFFYLFSIGIGVGALVGQLPGPHGPVDYDQFVAPAMLATAAMNGCVFDTTFNFFDPAERVQPDSTMVSVAGGMRLPRTANRRARMSASARASDSAPRSLTRDSTVVPCSKLPAAVTP